MSKETMMKFTISSDPLIQYHNRGNMGMYDHIFRKLTPEANCLVFEDFDQMEKIAQALDGWIKRNRITGAKVKTTKSHPMDGRPRCWLAFPPVVEPPKTEIRGNFPKEIK